LLQSRYESALPHDTFFALRDVLLGFQQYDAVILDGRQPISVRSSKAYPWGLAIGSVSRRNVGNGGYTCHTTISHCH
jgi:hypothetical protein